MRPNALEESPPGDPLPFLGNPAKSWVLSPPYGPAPAPVAEAETAALSLVREVWQGCWRRDSWTRAALLRLTLIFLFAILCSWLGIVLSRQSEGVATIWLSNGLLFGLLITQPKRRWLAYFLAGLAADTCADLLYGDPFQTAIGVSVANSVEVVTSCLLLTLWFDSPLDLSKRKSLVGFLLVSVLGATAIASALGAWWTVLMVGGAPWWQMFRTWYLGDMLGMALLAPMVITVQRPAFFSMFERKHLPDTLLVLSLSVVVTALVFSASNDPLFFFMFPVFLLVAFDLGLPGTVVNIFLVTLMAIGFTVKGYGPLMLITGEHMLLHRIVIAQLFAAVAIFTMFPVAALLEEKEALKNSLAASEVRYRNLAHVDELTCLPNRRAFNFHFEQAWSEAFASDKPLGLIILDADHFKQYNDDIGHPAGDACLRAIAQVLSRTVDAAEGFAARIGGEEFAVILSDPTHVRAREVAENIRRSVVDLALPHSSSLCGVQTVSVGVAIRVPLSGEASIEMMKLADQALYAAKRAGRNQVTFN
jgi:diguanylate cyclase (GGDEF)-like protein